MKPKIKVRRILGGENPNEFNYRLDLSAPYGVRACAIYTSLHGITEDDTMGEVVNYLTVTQPDHTGRLRVEEHFGLGPKLTGSFDGKAFKASFSLKPSFWRFFF